MTPEDDLNIDKLKEYLTHLEERLDILEAGEIHFKDHIKEWADGVTGNVNERIDALIKVILSDGKLLKKLQSLRFSKGHTDDI